MISITSIIFILGIAMITAAIKGWIDAPRKRLQRVDEYGRQINRGLL